MKVSRRKFIGTLACGAAAGIMGTQRLFAEEVKPGILPKPSLGGDGSLKQALQLRKSTRSFDGKPIPEQILSDLLWAAFGVNRPKSEKRTAPSAMNWQEIDIYVITASGLFLYEPTQHSLNQISTDDIRKLAGRQKYVHKAPVNFIYVSDYLKIKKGSEEQKLMYTAANTGFIGQNVYLFCAVNGLGAVVRGYIDRPALAKAMKLRDDQKIVLAQSVGYLKS